MYPNRDLALAYLGEDLARVDPRAVRHVREMTPARDLTGLEWLKALVDVERALDPTKEREWQDLVASHLAGLS